MIHLQDWEHYFRKKHFKLQCVGCGNVLSHVGRAVELGPCPVCLGGVFDARVRWVTDDLETIEMKGDGDRSRMKRRLDDAVSGVDSDGQEEGLCLDCGVVLDEDNRANATCCLGCHYENEAEEAG